MPQFNRMKIARELFPACKLFPHTRNARAHSLNCYRAVASRKIIVVYKFWVQSEHDLQSELDLTKSSRFYQQDSIHDSCINEVFILQRNVKAQ